MIVRMLQTNSQLIQKKGGKKFIFNRKFVRCELVQDALGLIVEKRVGPVAALNRRMLPVPA